MSSIHSGLDSITIPEEYSHVLKETPLSVKVIKKIFEVYCKILFTVYCPLKIIGRENIPKSASFIFCSNHNSHMDSGILMVASGLPFKNFAMIAAKDYFFDNTKRNYLNLLMNLIPIERNADKKSILNYLAACREFTKSGNRSIIVYPEGTRSLNGKLQPFKKGPAMISAELNLPIVPAYIEGSFKAWPKGKVFMKPAKLKIIIGEPIYPEKYICKENPDENNFIAYKKITEELTNRIWELKRTGEKNA